MATYRARVAVEESNHTFQLFQPDAYSCARCPDQWTSPWSGSTGHGGCDWNACYSDPLGSSLFAPHYRWLGSSNAIARRGKVCSCALLPWEDNNRNNKNYTLEDKNIYTPSLRAVPIRNIYIYIYSQNCMVYEVQYLLYLDGSNFKWLYWCPTLESWVIKILGGLHQCVMSVFAVMQKMICHSYPLTSHSYPLSSHFYLYPIISHE